MKTQQIPATRNSSWGFWGTMGKLAGPAWPLAMADIAEATKAPLETVRVFLDSPNGRHFADQVRYWINMNEGLPGAIEAAIKEWMNWRISANTARNHGIPRGLPYLTGWVLYYADH